MVFLFQFMATEKKAASTLSGTSPTLKECAEGVVRQCELMRANWKTLFSVAKGQKKSKEQSKEEYNFLQKEYATVLIPNIVLAMSTHSRKDIRDQGKNIAHFFEPGMNSFYHEQHTEHLLLGFFRFSIIKNNDYQLSLHMGPNDGTAVRFSVNENGTLKVTGMTLVAEKQK